MRPHLMMMMLACVVSFATGKGWGAEPKKDEGREQTGTTNMNVNDKAVVLNLAAKMNVFRLSAGFDVDRALEVWATPGFNDQWAKEVAVGFKDPGTKNQLRDFFSSAVVMIGRYQEGRAVVLFYNPWADALLLLSVQPGKGHPVLAAFQFMAGESWRKEAPRSMGEVLAMYTGKEPLLKVMAPKYAAVENRFNEEYPIQGAFEFLPPAVKADAGANAEELPPIVIRLSYRQRMFGVLLSKGNKDVLKVVHDLRKIFAAPTFEALSSYLSPKQNTDMLQSVSQLPTAMLKNMSPNYFARAADGKSCLVGMVNADTPRWFMAVRIESSQGAPKPGVTLEAFDLGVSSKLMADAATRGTP